MKTYARRARVVSCQLSDDRPLINAVVDRATHDAFDVLAKSHNLGKSTLARLLIEAVARNPKLINFLVSQENA